MRIAGAAGVHLDATQVQGPDRIEHEVREVIGRHPLAQIRRQQQRSIAIDIDETSGHEHFQQIAGQTARHFPG